VIQSALAAPDPTAQDLFEGLYSGKGVR